MRHILVFLALSATTMANEQAFPPTPPGTAELKTLPAGTLLKAARSGDYFGEDNRLFFPLFNYITAQGINMTVPVEAQVEGGAAMYFWVGRNELDKLAGSKKGVEVVQIPERKVAVLGAKGSYSRANFEKTRDALLVWLAAQTGIEAAGPAYAVYWNGPTTLWFAKRYEVHVPVRPRG